MCVKRVVRTCDGVADGAWCLTRRTPLSVRSMDGGGWLAHVVAQQADADSNARGVPAATVATDGDVVVVARSSRDLTRSGDTESTPAERFVCIYLYGLARARARTRPSFKNKRRRRVPATENTCAIPASGRISPLFLTRPSPSPGIGPRRACLYLRARVPPCS